MKKIVLAIAILLANGIFVSCTDLEENQEQILQEEFQNSGGEEDQDPDDGEDPDGD